MSDDFPILSVVKTSATILAVAATVMIARRQFRKDDTSLPVQLRETGTLRLTPSDFGKEPEILSDATRACSSGGVCLLRLPPKGPAGAKPVAIEALSRPPVDDTQEINLARYLHEALEDPDGGFAKVSEMTILRVVSMLSIGPALAVLQSLDCPPMFQHHRFVLVRSASCLRVMVLGYVGAPGQRLQPWVLKIVSENLLEEARDDRGPLASSVRYSVQRAASRSNNTEEEIESSLPGWAQEYR